MVNAFNRNDTLLFPWQPQDSGLQNKDRKKGPLEKKPKKRELSVQEEIAAKKQEKYQRDKKFLNELKTSLAQNKSEIIDEYKRYLMKGYKIYEDYPEYPRHDDFKGVKEEERNAAGKFAKEVRIRDQTYAWYFRTVFEDLAKYIPGKKQLEEIRGVVLNEAKTIVNDISEIVDSIEEYQLIPQQAKKAIESTDDRKKELKKHLKILEALKATSELRKLQKGNINNNSQRAQERAAFLEGCISVVKKHQDNTENSIKNHMDKANHRLTAAQEKEKAAVSDQEKVVAQALRAQVEGDVKALKNLSDEQKLFQGALNDLAQKEVVSL